jgi:hypothetical protein
MDACAPFDRGAGGLMDACAPWGPRWGMREDHHVWHLGIRLTRRARSDGDYRPVHSCYGAAGFDPDFAEPTSADELNVG